MACGRCGGKRADSPADTGLVPGYTAKVTDNGMYQLGAWLECSEPYSGDYQREDVFVIGMGTEAERVFKRTDNEAAVKWAKESRTRLTRVTAHTLCHEAMVELFGS